MELSASEELTEHQTDFFDRFAPGYDAWADRLHERVAEGLSVLAAPRRGEHALDVATGTGLVARRLAEKVGKRGSVIGIDISAGMLEIAKRQLSPETPQLSYMGMAAEYLLFKDGTFDLVALGDALSYLIDPAAALREAARVLRPGGRLALSCHRRSLGTEAQDIFFRSLSGLAERHHLSVPRHTAERARFGEPEPLQAVLAEIGLEPARPTAMVTGGRAADARRWTELMAGAGPLPYTLISVLGPRLRAEFEEQLDLAMGQLGEEAYRYHHAFTLIVAHKPKPKGPGSAGGGRGGTRPRQETS